MLLFIYLFIFLNGVSEKKSFHSEMAATFTCTDTLNFFSQGLYEETSLRPHFLEILFRCLVSFA